MIYIYPVQALFSLMVSGQQVEGEILSGLYLTTPTNDNAANLT